MRRSSSTSRIPVVRLFRENSSESIAPSSSKKVAGATVSRGQSFGRGTIKRAVSTDRLAPHAVKRSISNLSSQFKRSVISATPLTGNASKRSMVTPSYSQQRGKSQLTPSSGSSIRSARSPHVSRKADRHPNDKQWVAQEFRKVQCFLTCNGVEARLVNELKPPSINNFNFVTNFLFKKIFRCENFSVSPLENLKVLGFPGNLSNSHLKTVNAMHTWPHIINAWSWLVDLIGFLEQDADEVLAKDPIDKIILDHLCKRFIQFSERNDESAFDEEFVKQLNSHLGVEQTVIQQLQDETKSLRETKRLKNEEISQTTAKIEKIDDEIERMRREMETFYREDTKIDVELQNQLEELENACGALEKKISVTKTKIKEVEVVIENQPCTLAEKEGMWLEVNMLQNGIDLKKATLKRHHQTQSQQAEVRNDFAIQLNEKVHESNQMIKLQEAMYPQIKTLLIEGNYSSPDFEEQMKQIPRKIQELNKDISEKRRQMETALCKLLSENGIKQQEFFNLKEKITVQDSAMQALREDIVALQQDFEKTCELGELEIKQLVERKNNLEKTKPDLQSAYDALEQLVSERNEKEKLLGDNCMHITNFFKGLNDKVMKNLNDMTEIRTQLIKSLEETENCVVKQQHQFMQKLNDLKSVLRENDKVS